MDDYRDIMSTKFYSAKIETKDAKPESRRYRNILANSGEIMESGEIRNINQLFVMGYDSELYRIADLNTNPEKQTERYAVKAQADHGEFIDGELVPSIEKQFGSCRVWLEDDGLHARMYFATDDVLADHAWAISEDASYSTGIDWYPDGYYGAGHEIEEPIGILREISMVLTGNDPRAQTIDTKTSKGQRAADDGDKNNLTERNTMSETKDNLTPDERTAILEELTTVVNKFTTDAPESETEPTRRDTKDGEGEAEGEKVEEKVETETKTNDNIKHQPVVVIRDRAVKQEKAVTKNDWLHGEAGHRAFADTLKRVGRLGDAFDTAWRAEASKHMSLDGITGLPNPAPVEQYFANALEKSDGIISHFQFISAKSFRIHMLSVAADGNGRAAGHKKGDTKQNQDLADTTRDLLVKMVYKRLDLDATELYENPWLIDFRSQELVNAIIVEIERAAIIGDGRTYSGSGADLRMFDGTRGFYSIAADTAATSGIGTYFADSVSVAGNLYDGVVAGRGKIKTEGTQYIVAKSNVITAMLAEKTANGYLVQPGSRIEDILGVDRVYTPAWMENADADAFLIVNNAYKHGGENQIRVRAEFDTSTNTDILLDETPRFGSLGEYKSAVAITLGDESES